MITIALANQKGGTGKTHSTHALGTGLTQLGYQVLMLDCDPQSSLTNACGIQTADPSLYDVFRDNIPITSILQRIDNNLTLAPSDIALADTELDLVNRMGREGELMRLMVPVADSFDVCLIDTAPSLGLLSVNALNAADGVIIPTLPQVQDLRGVNLFMGTLTKIRERLNPNLEVIGILVTMYDGRLVHHQDAVEAMKEAGLSVLDMMIGRSVKVAEAAAAGESILTYDTNHKISDQYRALAREVKRWLENEQG